MKLLSDYSFVHGVNHYVDNDEEHLRRELSYGRRVGLNSLRVWLWYGEFERDPDGYVKRLRSFVRVSFDCGYTVMPILFNGNGINPMMLEEDFIPRAKRYIEAVVGGLREEPGILMWDVMNEPACNNWIGGVQGEERAAREEKLWSFVRFACRYVKQIDGFNAITVGYTVAYEAPPTVEEVDVISFHDYQNTRAAIIGNYEFAKSLSEKYGKPYMNTETGCLARANPYDLMLEISYKYNIGWYLFELMIHDRCDSEHGIFYPDGTVRDPSTISAIMGCFRKREGVMVKPIPNREGASQQFVDAIRNALREYTCDAFDYRRSDVSKLLDACEQAANLLECCEMIEMAVPPTYKILKWRKEEKPDLDEIRAFAYSLAKRLSEISQLL